MSMQSMFDPKAEAGRIAFELAGNGDPVLMISGFPQTRRSWNRLVPLLSSNYRTIAADLPSFGDSGILPVPATTENVGKIFHEFVRRFSPPLHVVAHDFGAWVAFSWVLMFPGDFKSLTLIDAGIPGITLTEEIQLSDFKRKWNFIFQMLPDLPAGLARGKEDLYVGWWFKNKVHDPAAISAEDVAACVAAYARPGRMDAAMDYCRRILDDMEFNKSRFESRLAVPLLAVGGQHAIPNMGEALAPYFRAVTPVVIPDCGHFVPEEQPQALAHALMPFLKAADQSHGGDIRDRTGFKTDIRPLFTERDVQAMSRAFNLASYEKVKAHAAAIYDRIRGIGGAVMPPPPPRGEGPWPRSRIDLFGRWIADGCPP